MFKLIGKVKAAASYVGDKMLAAGAYIAGSKVVAAVMALVAVVCITSLARATGDTAPTPFDPGIDVGAGASAAITSFSPQFGTIIGISMGLVVLGVLCVWAYRGLKRK